MTNKKERGDKQVLHCVRDDGFAVGRSKDWEDWPKGGEERDSHTCTLNSREYHSRARGRTKECTRATDGFIFDCVCVPGDDSGRRGACGFAGTSAASGFAAVVSRGESRLVCGEPAERSSPVERPDERRRLRRDALRQRRAVCD